MLSGRDEGPVYYREIQKNAYLKRIPTESSGKLRPLTSKKPPLKPMWTLLCVHNGRTPFLEQYPDPESPATLSHKPVWRACLRSTRHVTASVKPHVGDEYDFLVDTDHGPVRMLAPDWDSMQEWVTTLRNKLHELKVLSKGENVYCIPPAAPPPRAAARDPTSPLPPTPPVPPDRVPGIELTTPVRTQQENQPEPEENAENTQLQMETHMDNIDISNWDTSFESQPSTSQETKIETKGVTKICGQNICLDDSILKRSVATDSDDEFFADVDSNDAFVDYTQRVIVNNDDKTGDGESNNQATNITVIQVSNKPPHTAIPVLGPETDVFNFDIDASETSFVNIINTDSADNGYGTVFNESDYGHLSLTTTVSLTGTDVKPDNESVYERLCLASTSNTEQTNFQSPVIRLKNIDKTRKSSLPNLDVATSSDTTYEYLFPSQNNNRVVLNSDNREINCNDSPLRPDFSLSRTELTQNRTGLSQNRTEVTQNRTELTQNRTELQNNGPETASRQPRSELPQRPEVQQIRPEVQTARSIQPSVSEFTQNRTELARPNVPQRPTVHVNLSNSMSVGANVDSNSRALRSNVERSHSQNAYDTSPGLRNNLIRRVQNNSPKRNEKTDESDAQAKPIWKRGLTELSFLSRLRGIGHGKRQESPTRNEDHTIRSNTSPVKVIHRSRPENRVDSSRRRSNSLSNGQSPPAAALQQPLIPLRARQAATLRAEQRRGAAIASTIPANDPPIFCDYNTKVWIAWWPAGAARCGGRAGDRVAALRGTAPRDARHAKQLVNTSPAHIVDILFHRVPLGKIYVLNKRDHESIGIKLDKECNINSVEGLAARQAGIPPPGKWAVTELNNRPLDLIKGGEEEMNRLSLNGTEVSLLIQPAPLVKKIRSAIKANRTLLSMAIR